MNPDSADHDIVEQVNDLLAEALGDARIYVSHDEARPSAIRGFDKVQEAQELLTEIDHTRSFEDTEQPMTNNDNEVCPVCGEEYNMFVDNGYRNGWPTEGGDVAMIKFEVCTTSDSDWMYVHTEGITQIMCGDGLAAIQNSNTDE